MQVTDHIPIVFVVDDPVGTGIVSSSAHPGGHATGMNSLSGSGLARKRLEWLAALVPGLSRLAFLTNLSTPIPTRAESPLRETAGQLGVQGRGFHIPTSDDLEAS